MLVSHPDTPDSSDSIRHSCVLDQRCLRPKKAEMAAVVHLFEAVSRTEFEVELVHKKFLPCWRLKEVCRQVNRFYGEGEGTVYLHAVC